MGENTMKKILVVALILVLALQLMPLAASAEELSAPTKLWVAPSETNGIPVQIDVFKANTGTNYNPTYTFQLYLPGDAILENCFLSWDGGLQATVGACDDRHRIAGQFHRQHDLFQRFLSHSAR